VKTATLLRGWENDHMEYAEVIQTAAIVFTIVAFGATQYSNRKSTNADSFIRINGEYNRMVTFRLEHPEVVQLAAEWKSGHLDSVAMNKEIARYYSYGELCISFCTVCLYHRRSNSISKVDFDNYYSGLMDLVATENRAFFEDIVKNKYCAREFKTWFGRWREFSAKAPASLSQQ
jgi:hypothetical protein